MADFEMSEAEVEAMVEVLHAHLGHYINEEAERALIRWFEARPSSELWQAIDPCWSGSGCIHDTEGGCADAFWRLAKRLRSEAP